MEIVFNNKNDKDYLKLLNDLLKDIFFDMSFWHDLNVWNEDYESYSIIENGKMLSNICAYKTKIVYNGKEMLAIQLGGVGTRKESRGRGLSKLLMEHVLDKYKDFPIFLAANPSVIDFYPKFGFVQTSDMLPVLDISVNNDISEKKLSSNDPKVMDYIYSRVNFSNRFDCLNTESVNILYMYLDTYKDHIYELDSINTMIVAKKNNNILKLYGVFSKEEVSFDELVMCLPFKDVERLEFGFMPYWDELDYDLTSYEGELLFIKNMDDIFNSVKFPELSYT